jgi:hypothetical protein
VTAPFAKAPRAWLQVVWRRPRCPYCGGWRILAYRSSDNGDGTLTRRVQCRTCDKRFILIVE